jgi:hypothetical protein
VPVAGLDDGVRVGLQVQPPRGLGRAPPVHRHGHEVGAVLEVAEHDLAGLPTAPSGRGEPQRPPAARPWAPQPQPAPARAQQSAVAVPERHDHPPWREPGMPAARRCSRLAITGHDPSVAPRGGSRQSPGSHTVGPCRG